MLQPSKFSRSPLELQNTDLQTILADTAVGRLWQSLTQLLRLPNDFLSFLLFLMVLSVLCGGLILHIHLSSQIFQAHIQIDNQQAVFDSIEQQNSEIVWQINQSVSLNKIRQRAAALGYVDMPDHQFIGSRQLDLALISGSSTAVDSNQFATNTQPHFASSTLNTEAAISSVATLLPGATEGLGMGITANPAIALEMSDPSLAGLQSHLQQWRQWALSWLSPARR